MFNLKDQLEFEGTLICCHIFRLAFGDPVRLRAKRMVFVWLNRNKLNHCSVGCILMRIFISSASLPFCSFLRFRWLGSRIWRPKVDGIVSPGEKDKKQCWLYFSMRERWVYFAGAIPCGVMRPLMLQLWRKNASHANDWRISIYRASSLGTWGRSF